MSKNNYVFFEKEDSRYFKLNMLGGGYQRFSLFARRSDGRPRLRLNDARNSESILSCENFVEQLIFFIRDYWDSSFKITKITKVAEGKDFELIFDIVNNNENIDYLSDISGREQMFLSESLMNFFDYFSRFLCDRSSWYGSLKHSKVLYSVM